MGTRALFGSSALLIVLVALGCGYRPLDPSGVYGPDVRSIEIGLFGNESAEPGFERMLGEAFVEEFARRGVLTPLYGGNPGATDLVLRGVVREVEVTPSAFSSVSLTLEDNLEVTIDVSVSRAETQEEIWRHDGLTLSERFLSSPDPQVYQSNKEQTLRSLTAEIAGRIHDELFQDF